MRAGIYEGSAITPNCDGRRWLPRDRPPAQCQMTDFRLETGPAPLKVGTVSGWVVWRGVLPLPFAGSGSAGVR